MATRSTIAVQHNDGTISQIYCHFDGYIDHNGNLLKNFYNDLQKAEELVALGDLSGLNEEIGEKHSFDWWLGSAEDHDLYEQFGNKWCTAYGRDRGETHTEARKFDSLQDYKNNCQNEEYNYVFVDGEWLVSLNGSRKWAPFSVDITVDLTIN